MSSLFTLRHDYLGLSVFCFVISTGIAVFATWEAKMGKVLDRTKDWSDPWYGKNENASQFWTGIFFHYFFALAFCALGIIPHLTSARVR